MRACGRVCVRVVVCVCTCGCVCAAQLVKITNQLEVYLAVRLLNIDYRLTAVFVGSQRKLSRHNLDQCRCLTKIVSKRLHGPSSLMYVVMNLQFHPHSLVTSRLTLHKN